MSTYLYLRVSTDRQGESGGGLNAQRDQAQRFAALEDLTIDSEFVDVAESRSKKPGDRKAFMALLSVLEEGDSVLVPSRDRLGEGIESAIIERDLKAAGVNIISAQGIGNGDSPEEVLSRRLHDAVSEYEHASIIRRTRSSLQAKKERGQVYCKRLYGYCKVDGAFVENPEEQTAIRDMQRLRKSGLSYNKIAKHLTKSGVPTPGGSQNWRHGTVKDILVRNPS